MTAVARRTLMAGAAALLGPPAVARAAARTVALPAGGEAPALGQGTWHLAQGRHPAADEEAALRTGLEHGMTLIDTAETYGEGRAEEMVGRVVAGRRERVFIVSKVTPSNAMRQGIRSACAASLQRLGTDYLDLYLLHWRGAVGDLLPVVSTFEALAEEGRIRRWGVSNFGVAGMQELFGVPGGRNCACDQVGYNLGQRRAEGGLLPWCQGNGLPIMAYSPLGSGGGLLRSPALARVAERHGVSPAAVALAWTLRDGRTIPIPESGSVEHVKENAAALGLSLDTGDLAVLDQAFPA